MSRSSTHAGVSVRAGGAAPRVFSLDAHPGLRSGIGCEQEDAGTLARRGEHHALGNAKFHLARREVRDHRASAVRSGPRADRRI